jgi:hypothetical protein
MNELAEKLRRPSESVEAGETMLSPTAVAAPTRPGGIEGSRNTLRRQASEHDSTVPANEGGWDARFGRSDVA